MAGITLSGVNGIDFNTILEAVMEFESQPLKALQDEQKKVQDKDSAFVSLSGIVSAMQSAVGSLTGASAFARYTATSSDSTVLSVTVGDEGAIGPYEVSVTQLAKAQVTPSNTGYSEQTAVAADGGSLSFTINGQTTDPIVISSSTTLGQLKQLINEQESGVRASIVNDGTNYKLVITGRNSGSVNGFTINNSLTNSGGTAVAFAPGQSASSGNAQNAQNALLTVNGISVASASNKVANAIPGATITLLTTGNATATVDTDFEAIKNDVKSFVTQYNKLRQFNTQQVKGVLGGDPVLREVLNDLRTVMVTSNSNGGRYHYLSEIGIELTSSGELKLDEAKFDSAMGSYSSDVEKLFKGATGTAGIYGTLKTTLAGLDGSAGLIKTTRDRIRDTVSQYADRIEKQQLRLEIRRKELTRQYTAADQAMSRLNQMTSAISNLQRQTI